MKVSLEGLFSNVVSNLKKDQRDYYEFCLGEVVTHLKSVIAGEHTIAEFAEHYCLTAPTQSAAANTGDGK